MTLMCVGGPYHGQRYSVPRGSRSLIIATNEPTWIMDAHHQFDPSAVVPFERAVYKLETLRHEMGETTVQMKVLAYYGRAAQDRPENWYL